MNLELLCLYGYQVLAALSLCVSLCLFIGNGPMLRQLPVRDNPDLELPLLQTKDDYCEDTNDEEEHEILY